MSRPSLGEAVGLTSAAVLAVISFLPYWASLKIETTDSVVVIDGPTRFSAWDAYPVAVQMGVGLSFLVLALGLARLITGRPSISPTLLYSGAGAVITVLLLYGLWEGPGALFPFLAPSNSPGLFEYSIERGPLLYVGLVAALAVTAGGFLARRADPA